MERMVMLKNTVNAKVCVTDGSVGITRYWNKKGHTQGLPFGMVEQLLWNEGFRRMLEDGTLYIENLQDKIDLGLEPTDAKEPVNIIVLNDKQMEEYLTTIPFTVFQKEIEKLTRTQVDNLVQYAIEHRLIDSQKCRFLKELTGKDILKTISFKEDMEASDNN